MRIHVSKGLSRRTLASGSAAFGLALLGGRARAQAAWPNKPIQVVVPFAAGGPTDVQMRLVAEGLSERLGQQLVIENRAGAGGNVGAAAVARAAADGYTLLAGTVGTHAINEFLYKTPGFRPQEDFAPVAMIGSGPNVLVVAKDFPARTVAELVVKAKAEAGKLNYASPGAGTSNHLAMELFKSRAGIDVTAVNFRGAGPALNDVMAGHVPMMFNGIDNALPMIEAGSVRALAISSRARSTRLPDVPTLIESGFAEFETASWTALFAPAGTPGAIIDRLNALVREVTGVGKVADRYAALGLVAPQLAPADLRNFVVVERKRWEEAVKAAGVQAQ
jgi:tripartite-type tricarboxylate transporter receptor subunit TctC